MSSDRDYDYVPKNIKPDQEGYYYQNFGQLVPYRPVFGCRTMCTPETTQQIGMMVAQGLTQKDAADAMGISHLTIDLWRRRGAAEFDRLIDAEQRGQPAIPESAEEPYLLFYEVLKWARVERKRGLLDNISMAAAIPKHWRAGEYLLQTEYPEQYGRKHTLEVKDWRYEVVGLIRDGLITVDILREDIDDENEIKRLYERAGVDFPSEGEGDSISRESIIDITDREA